MKKRSSLLLVMLLVVFATGCGKKETVETANTEATSEAVETVDSAGAVESDDVLDETSTDEVAQTEETTDVENSDDQVNPYGDILAKYKLALTEQWDMEKLMNEGLSPLCQYCYGETPDLSKVGFLMSDIDGNEIEELVIGSLSDDEFTKNMIFDLYTQVDGEVVQVFQGQERDRYYSTDSGLIYNEGSGGAGNSAYCNFKLEGSTLILIEGLINHGMDDPENPWSYTVDSDGDTSNDTAVTEEKANALMQTFMESFKALSYFPFTELE